MGAEASAVNVTATGVVSGVPASLRGCSIRDTSGATNTIKIFDNASAASGTLAQWTTAGANADKAFDFADGVRCINGIYLSASAGTVTGNVRIG